MNAVAIIVEYNPFHNGHLYQIQTVKEKFPNDTLIIILNGDFLQRGEPALLDKWFRTKWALAGGADLVVELPFVFGTQRADIFAEGGVKIAHMLGVSTLCFGVEISSDQQQTLEDFSPNQKLAYFYKEKIKTFAPQMQTYEIPRIHSEYNDVKTQHQTIASATAIRRMLDTQDKKLSQYVPNFVYKDLIEHQHLFAKSSDYYNQIQHLALMKPINEYPALTTGGTYENFQKGFVETTNYKTFFEFIHQKHMSRTHTQRALTYILTQTTHQQLDDARQQLWSRVLGYNWKGQTYLRTAKKQLDDQIVLIQKPSLLQNPSYVLQYNSTVASAIIRNMPIKEALSREFDQRAVTDIYEQKE